VYKRQPHLDWLLLTKRPENIRKFWPLDCHDGNLDRRHNVWLGTSISDQETYDKYAHLLYHYARDLASVLFLSIEPLLGPIKMWHEYDGEKVRNWQGAFDWVIAGGESGHHARPMHPDWARSLRDQCAAANVPFFFKQWGEWLPISHGGSTGPLHRWSAVDDSSDMVNIGKKHAGRLLDGREHNAVPSVSGVAR
jgi:protein gp37